jgi:Laminin B (Domain IV)
MSQQLIQDIFEDNASGWLIGTFPTSADKITPNWSVGKISYTPADNASNYFFQAPAKYIGNQSHAFGETFSFSLVFNTSPRTFKNDPLVIITGGGVSIGIANIAPVIGTNGNYSFTVKLDDTAAWKLISNNTVATAQTIKSVLKNVTSILIRGDITVETVVVVNLISVALAYNPTFDLKIDASIYYQQQKLYASWDAVIYAYKYKLEVRDNTQALVYSTLILAKDFIAPVELGGQQWSPEVDKTYTLSVAALGPDSDPVTVTTVDIGKAELTVSITNAGVVCTWSAIDLATTYNLYVQLGSDQTKYIVKKEHILASPFTITEQDGLVPDTAYNALLRGRAGNSLGDWSDPVPFTLVSARKILTDLQVRLNNNNPAENAVIFNEVTFPIGGGNPEQVLALIKDKFSINSLTILLSSPVNLSLNCCGNFDNWNQCSYC